MKAEIRIARYGELHRDIRFGVEVGTPFRADYQGYIVRIDWTPEPGLLRSDERRIAERLRRYVG